MRAAEGGRVLVWGPTCSALTSAWLASAASAACHSLASAAWHTRKLALLRYACSTWTSLALEPVSKLPINIYIEAPKLWNVQLHTAALAPVRHRPPAADLYLSAEPDQCPIAN